MPDTSIALSPFCPAYGAIVCCEPWKDTKITFEPRALTWMLWMESTFELFRCGWIESSSHSFRFHSILFRTSLFRCTFFVWERALHGSSLVKSTSHRWGTIDRSSCLPRVSPRFLSIERFVSWLDRSRPVETGRTKQGHNGVPQDTSFGHVQEKGEGSCVDPSRCRERTRQGVVCAIPPPFPGGT